MYANCISKNIRLIEKFISKQKIKSILIAISGGQDSIILIKLSEQIKKRSKENININYIYIDHQWKENSHAQIKQIINYITSIKSKIITYQIQKKTKSENTCRTQRYHIIIQHAVQYDYKLILTGHHNNDKVETFFQNIYRGSGIEGINSLVSKNELYKNIFILRPILDLDKHQIYWLCKKTNLPIWSDSTNYLYSIKRNRIRNELIPYMHNFYSHKLEDHILYLMQLYYYENEYIKQNCIKLYLKARHKSRIAINHKMLQKNHFALQTRIIQLFIFHNFRINADTKKILKIIKNINNVKTNQEIIVEHKKITYFIDKKWIYAKIK